MPTEFHAMSGEEALSALGSSEGGLTSEEAARRLVSHGPNELSEGRRISPLSIFLDQFRDYMVIILIVAALISAGIGVWKDTAEEFLDAGIITVIVLVNAILGFVQNYRAEKTMQALRDMAAPKANVIRDGEEKSVPSRELVPGDVIILSTGDRISADARLLEAANLKTDEASLTGESLPVSKNAAVVLPSDALLSDRDNMVFSGCTVDHGRGRAVVTSTGMLTQLGNIARMVQSEDEDTPLQRKLERLGKQLGIMVLGVCAFIFAVGYLRGVAAEEMFLTSVSLAVAAIPGGLPAVVTISLALGLQRMARRKAVMRRLPAVESLGSATVICTDKTGTLTKGEMNVREIFMEETINVSGEGFEPRGKFLLQGETMDMVRREDLTMLLVAGALCNDSSLYREDGKWKVRGDPTEGTLIVTARKAGIDEVEVGRNSPRIFEIAFDSVKKRMTTVHEVDGRRMAFMKGAAESVVPLCTRRRVKERDLPLDKRTADSLLVKNNEMAGRALRVLAIAARDVTDVPLEESALERDFTFLGLVGMMDAPRREAMEAVRKCRTAGIRVIMITGDHELTARAIALEMGIAEPGRDRVVNGRVLETASDEELEELLKEVSVFARVAPEHKVRIVDALQALGEIVAMTGDGVNDAPALKKADIGVAMGITGTDVSKEASQMVLMDDNFASIVNAVEEGRGVYDNIRKFVAFLLSCNSGEVIAMFAASLIFVDPELIPFLLPVHLLWMNLVTDGLPALALGVEPIEPNIMERPPNDPQEPPVTRRMAIRVLSIGGAFALSALLAYVLVDVLDLSGGGDEVRNARTVAFCTMVFSQLFFAFSARSQTLTIGELGLSTNRKMIAAVAVSAMLQLAVVYLPGLSDAFRTAQLGWEEWALVLPLSMPALILNEIWKVAARRPGKA
jgi:Ca2+-transporting ATPase